MLSSLKSLLRIQKEMTVVSKLTVEKIPTNLNRNGKEKPYLKT